MHEGVGNKKSKNIALLTSLAWRMINNTNSLWTRIVSNKYANARGKSLNSFIWKSILKGWYYCNLGTRRDINSKTNLNVWDSNQIPNVMSIRKVIAGPLPKNEDKLTVNKIRKGIQWTLTRISFKLPTQIIDNINAITIPKAHKFKH